MSASDAVIGIPSRLESMNTVQQTAHETQLAAFKEQSAALGAVREDITRLGSGFKPIRETMETMASASATSHGMLEQILQHVVRLSLSNQASSNAAEVQGRSMAATATHGEARFARSQPYNELIDIITRLHNKVHDNQLQGRIMSGEAKAIIGDLLLGLELMNSDKLLQTATETSVADSRIDICSTCRGHNMSDLHTSLTTIHAALSLTRQVTVNDTSKDSGLSPIQRG